MVAGYLRALRSTGRYVLVGASSHLSGKVVPVIDRRYALGETNDAIRYLQEGHARGKIVITV
jgi:hypothetical protein